MTISITRVLTLACVVIMTASQLAIAEVTSGEGFTQEVTGPPTPFPVNAIVRPPVIDGPIFPAMPDPRVGDYGDSDGPGTLMHYDMVEGRLSEITDLPWLQSGGLPDGSGSQFEGILPSEHAFPEFDDLGRGFANMGTIADPSLFPARVNCKLFMQFTDTAGTQRWFEGSGTMIDGQTVITAGHCVYARTDSNGFVYNDWADQIWVVPALLDTNGDGVGDVDNFGMGLTVAGADMYWFTGWSNNGDFDWDIGWVNIERPVGMLTGWFGSAWDSDCASVIDNNTFFNFSYPAENCPLAGLHNGVQMYFWSGTFDDCHDDNQFELVTGGGNCFDTVWGGMSGSSAYILDDDGNRLVMGICSNSNRTNFGAYVRLWENAYDYMYGTIIPDGRGTDFDPHALWIRSSDDVIYGGESIPDFQMTIANPCNASATDSWDFTVFLSADDTIDGTETVLSVQSSDGDFAIGEMDNFTVNMVPPTIPISTPSGTYFVGVQASSSSDTDASNNVTQTWDTMPVFVIGVPSLSVIDLEVFPSLVEDGGIIDVDWTLENSGGNSTGFITVDYYISLNDYISTSDVLLGSDSMAAVGPGSSLNGSAQLTLPAGLAGNHETEYWVGMIVSMTFADPITGAIDDPITVFIRPENDDCDNATSISEGDTSFNTTYATTDGNDHASCQFDGQTYNDIWYTYTASCTGLLSISTCGQSDYDTDLVLYADNGSGCAGMSLLDCNDDTVGCDGYTSMITRYVVAGDDFYIRVGGYSSLDAGAGLLTVSCELVSPFNDDCTNALWAISGQTWIDTQLATTDGDAHPECDTEGDGGVTVNDIWYLWTADCTGLVRISTCDTVNYDSDLVLYRWEGDCATSQFVACNDDGAGCSNYSSLLEAEVDEGQEYLIRVGGWNFVQAGYGWMSIDCEPITADPDLDGDGDVDVDDLLILLGSFGTGDGGDVDGDGDTDVDDLLALLSSFGS